MAATPSTHGFGQNGATMHGNQAPAWYDGEGCVGGMCSPGDLLQCNGLFPSDVQTVAAGGTATLTWTPGASNFTRFKPVGLQANAFDAGTIATLDCGRFVRLTALTYRGTDWNLDANGYRLCMISPEAHGHLCAVKCDFLGEIDSGGPNILATLVSDVPAMGATLTCQGWLHGFAKRGGA